MLLGLFFTKCTPEENEDLPVHNSQIIHNAVTDVDGNLYSTVQIGGPTGAFAVIVYGVVAEFGVAGLATATMMAGILLILIQ